jgi:hypothetical protein
MSEKNEFAVQSLIDVLQEVQQNDHNYGEARKKV